MRLFFDENLSSRLPAMVATLFPGSVHGRNCGLTGCSDDEVWSYAIAHGLTIVSKDSDFQQRSLLFGHPPKVIWLRLGNCTTAEVSELIARNAKVMEFFDADPLESMLVLE